MASGVNFGTQQYFGFDPRTIPGCQLWLDSADRNTLFSDSAGTTLATVGGTVAYWKDKTGIHNYSNTTPANGPTYISATGGLGFSNSAQLLLTTSSWTNGGWDIFAMVQPLNSTASWRTLLRGASFDHPIIVNNGGTQLGFYKNTGAVGFYQFGSLTVTGGSNTLIYTSINSSLTYATALNGTTSTSAPSTTGSVGETNLFYSLGNYQLGGQPFGTIYEMIIVPNTTTAQRQQIEGYLAWKWNLTTSAGLVSPATISGLQLWLDAADSTTVTTSGSNVTQWNDKSGNGYNATQATAGNRPVYLNNRITFTRASSHFLNLPTNALPSGNSSYSYLIVMAFAQAIDGLGVIGGGNYGTNSGVFALRSIGTDGRIHQYWWNNDLQALTNVYSVNVPFILQARYAAGGTRATLRNGTQIVSDTPSARNQGTGNNTVGVTNPSPGPPEYLDGYINEILVFNRDLTTTERQQMEGYLAWKWNLSTSLPTTNPYYQAFTLPRGHPYSGIPPAMRNPTPLDFGPMLFWWDAADYGTFTPANPTTGTSITGWRDKVSGLTLSNSNASPTWSSNGAVFTNPSSTVSASTQNLVYSNVSSPYTTGQNFTIIVAHSPNLFTGFRCAFYMVAPLAFNTNPSLFAAVQPGASEGNSVGAYNGSSAWYQLQQAAASNTGAGNRRVDTILSAPSNFIWTNGTENTYSINNIGRGTTVSGTATITAIAMSTTSTIQGNRAYDGTIHEVLVYSSNLSSSAIRQVEGYLAWKWNVRPNLVSTHPFFNIPTASPLFVPSSLSNLVLWLDAADMSTMFQNTGGTLSVAGFGQTVNNWRDKSLSGLNAVATGTGATYQLNAGYPSLTFNGNRMNTATIPSTFLDSTGLTFFAVSTRTGANVTQGVLGTLVPEKVIRYDPANCIYTINNGTLRGGNNNTNGIRCFIDTASSFNGFVNGTNVLTSSTAVTYQAQTTSTFYQLGNLGSGANLFQGYINEIIVFNRAITTRERQQVEGYLAWKWGLQNSLPTTHPYYRFRP